MSSNSICKRLSSDVFDKMEKTVIPSELSNPLRIRQSIGVLKWIQEVKELGKIYLKENNEEFSICSDIISQIKKAYHEIKKINGKIYNDSEELINIDPATLDRAATYLLQYTEDHYTRIDMPALVEQLIKERFREPVFRIERALINRIASYCYPDSRSFKLKEYLKAILTFFREEEPIYGDIDWFLSRFEDHYSSFAKFIKSINIEPNDPVFEDVTSVHELNALLSRLDIIQNTKVPEDFETSHPRQFQEIQSILESPHKAKLFILGQEKRIKEILMRALIDPLVNEIENLRKSEDFNNYYVSFQDSMDFSSPSKIIYSLKNCFILNRKLQSLNENLKNSKEDLLTLMNKYHSGEGFPSQINQQHQEIKAFMEKFFSNQEWCEFLKAKDCLDNLQTIQKLREKIPNELVTDSISHDEDLLDACLNVCTLYNFEKESENINRSIKSEFARLKEKLTKKYSEVDSLDLDEELDASLSRWLESKIGMISKDFNQHNYVQVIKYFEERDATCTFCCSIGKSDFMESILQYLLPFANENDDNEQAVKSYFEEKKKLKEMIKEMKHFNPEFVKIPHKPSREKLATTYFHCLYRFYSFLYELNEEIGHLLQIDNSQIKFPPIKLSELKKAMEGLVRIMSALEEEDQGLLLPYLEEFPKEIFEHKPFLCEKPKELAGIIESFIKKIGLPVK